MAIALTVNGSARSVDVPETTTLLDVLRNHLGLMGTRYGCGLEQCGCCMVLVDGQPAYACTREVGTVAGRSVTTIEGLGSAGQAASAAAGLPRRAGRPVRLLPLRHHHVGQGAARPQSRRRARAEIVAALDKHLCRCGAHQRILRAVERAAATLRRPA